MIQLQLQLPVLHYDTAVSSERGWATEGRSGGDDNCETGGCVYASWAGPPDGLDSVSYIVVPRN